MGKENLLSDESEQSAGLVKASGQLSENGCTLCYRARQ
jgi:hypothetical protein